MRELPATHATYYQVLELNRRRRNFAPICRFQGPVDTTASAHPPTVRLQAALDNSACANPTPNVVAPATATAAP